MENLRLIYSSSVAGSNHTWIVPAAGADAVYQSYDSANLCYYFRCNFDGGTSKWVKLYYYPTRYGQPFWSVSFDEGLTTNWQVWGAAPVVLPFVSSYYGTMVMVFDWVSNAGSDTGLLTTSNFGGSYANCSPFAAAAYNKYWVPKSYEKKETRRYVEYAGTLSDGGFYARYRTAQYWTYELQMAGSILKTLLALFYPSREMTGAEEAGTIDTVRVSQNGAAGWTITWTRSTFGAWGPISGTQKTFGGFVYGRCPNSGLGE